MIGIILYKLLNLKEGLSIGGWVKYYFINQDGSTTLEMTDNDNYDPLTPAPQPNDNQHLLIIHGPGRIPTLPGTNQVFEEEYQRRFDEIMKSYDFNTTNRVEPIDLDLQGSIRSSDAEVAEVLPGCQSLSTTSHSVTIEDPFNNRPLTTSPITHVRQLRNTLLLTFYTRRVARVRGIEWQEHMDRPIHPESFHMAYINSNGHYTTRRGRDRSVEDLATSVNRWFNQRFVVTTLMDEDDEQEGYLSPRFPELTLGDMESYNFQTGFGFLSFLRRKSQSIDRCIEFIEIVKGELLRNGLDPTAQFNLTIHIYYDGFSHYFSQFPANILVYTFNNTNINDLLNNLFLINILFNVEDVAHTENPLSGACSARRRSDPGGAE